MGCRDEFQSINVSGLPIKYIVPTEFWSVKWGEICPKLCDMCSEGGGSKHAPTLAPKPGSSCAAEAQAAKDASMSETSMANYSSCLNSGCNDLTGSELVIISGFEAAGTLGCDNPLLASVGCDDEFQTVELVGTSMKALLPESMWPVKLGTVCPKHCKKCVAPTPAPTPAAAPTPTPVNSMDLSEPDGAERHGSMRVFILVAIGFVVTSN